MQFYASDEHLCTTVGAFIAEGLIAGDPAVVIATAAHQGGILEDLYRRHIDAAEAIRLGDLICLDADALLTKLMSSDRPDPEAFRAHVGDFVLQTMKGRRRQTMRAYGEMVDVLWQQDQPEQAILLERFWNELAHSHRFNLLCGYSIGHFYKHAEYADRVRAEHTHVVSQASVIPFAPRPA